MKSAKRRNKLIISLPVGIFTLPVLNFTGNEGNSHGSGGDGKDKKHKTASCLNMRQVLAAVGT